MRGLDEQRVTEWLVANVEGVAAPVTYTLIAGGHSNLTYAATDAAGRRLVVRRPPLGHVLATAHDMAREHRIISAVGRSEVPVPRCVGLCSDDAVNGAPFYVMDFVDGVVLDSLAKARAVSEDNRRALADALVDVLAQLHAVDVDAIGLGDLARKDAFVERQLKRWSKQWEASKTRELPVVDEVIRRLSSRIPAQQRASIVHGDYRFGNCLVDPDGARISAVLDWELCTLGDPLADLGYLRVWWTNPDESAIRGDEPTAAGGFGSFEALVERYERASGLDVGQLGYYVSLGALRLAVINAGVYLRYREGAMGEGQIDLAMLAARTETLAEMALAAVMGLS